MHSGNLNCSRQGSPLRAVDAQIPARSTYALGSYFGCLAWKRSGTVWVRRSISPKRVGIEPNLPKLMQPRQLSILPNAQRSRSPHAQSESRYIISIRFGGRPNQIDSEPGRSVLQIADRRRSFFAPGRRLRSDSRAFQNFFEKARLICSWMTAM